MEALEHLQGRHDRVTRCQLSIVEGTGSNGTHNAAGLRTKRMSASLKMAPLSMAKTSLTFVLLTNLRKALMSSVSTPSFTQSKFDEKQGHTWEVDQCRPVDSVVFRWIEHAKKGVGYLPWCPVGCVDCSETVSCKISHFACTQWQVHWSNSSCAHHTRTTRFSSTASSAQCTM